MSIETLDWNIQSDIEKIIQLLQSEKIVAGTGDTVPGLFAPVTKQAVDQLQTIKQRTSKPYVILISSIDDIGNFADVSFIRPLLPFMHKVWPGPVTLIVPAKKELPDFLQTPTNTIALRVPQHEGLQKLLKKFDGLFSTSANRAGQPEPLRVEDIEPEILNHVDAIVTDSIILEKPSQSSTILDCSGPTIQIVRKGAYPVVDLEKIYGQPIPTLDP